MRPCADVCQTLLRQPLAWIHPQRFVLDAAFDTPALRAQINRLLSAQGDPVDEAQAGSIAGFWLANWRLLPKVALLIGTRLAWPHLAAGGRVTRLSASQRVFAGYVQTPWLDDINLDDGDLCEQLQALGLRALLAFREVVPDGLCERLMLQFPLSVVSRPHDKCSILPDAALLKLAIQHARFYPNPD